MKSCAVICEYHPFHNGHKYQIDAIRQMGYDCVVAIMSGNLVQRGEPALWDKFTRAKAALLGGVDLVAENPSVYAMAPAPIFAESGVAIAERLGCDALAFGTESESAEVLAERCRQLDDPKVEQTLHEHLERGLSYPAAREAAYRSVFGPCPALRNPNDILAMEYLRALQKSGSEILPIAIPRIGAEHDGDLTHGRFASASYLRQRLSEHDWRTASPFIPTTTAVLLKECEKQGAVACMDNFEKPLLAAIRAMTAKEWLAVTGSGDGLEFRLFRAARSASSLSEFWETAGTKRYPLARIRRAVFSAYFGITEEMRHTGVPYVRILGMSKTGESFLRTCSSDGIPIALRATDLKNQSLFQTESSITDRYVLGYDKPKPCGSEWTSRLIKI